MMDAVHHYVATWLRQFYERLRAAGGPDIAAMRKLLIAVWSVSVHGRPFVPVFVRQ